MSLMSLILAFAPGVAARFTSPEEEEVKRLKAELKQARRELDELRLHLMRGIEDRRPMEMVDCTGRGRAFHLYGQVLGQASQAQAMAQYCQAQNAALEQQAFLGQQALQAYAHNAFLNPIQGD